MDQFHTPILCIRLGPSTHVIVVSSPNLTCEILKNQDEKFLSRPDMMSSYLISDGYLATIMSPEGEQWRKMKRIMKLELLSSPIHKLLQPKRDEEADQLVKYIFNQMKKQNNDTVGHSALINVRNVTRHFFGNIVRNMIFGRRFFGLGMEDGGPGEEDIEHIDAVLTLLKYLFAFCINDYFSWLRGKIDFDGQEKIMRTAIATVRKYQDPLIDERIRMSKNGAAMDRCDLLDVLIQHDNPKLTPDEIKAQVTELMAATIDNPSNAIEWIIGEMINDPMILRRASDELDHVVGRDRLVEEQDLPQLNYIKACIKEGFRLHPFGPFIPPHVSITDTTIGGYFIPKGSHVLLSRFGLGRNPNVWEDPLRFNPDRHLCGEGKQVVLSDNELRMIPFSSGKRVCPGMMLGSTMTIMLLARMVQGFTWEAPGNKRGFDLVENHDDLLLAKPLVAVAKPRLARHMYPKY
ncbi:hypothetical protein SSX86_020396 [Deinandra increscens subsp. villosa]|uniref:Cytochrome P450 n=1 Tax=Deinandra increscens subsp. villosa TaxID=3103831 RepID=A0AAP0CT15_9ASTR